MRRKIALYVHPAHGFDSEYLLFPFVDLWKARGIEMEVVDDPTRHIDADLAFLHVDLTDVPDSYRRLTDRYPIVVNGGRTSIAKRTISDYLVTRDSDYDGPVIVKSNANLAGVRDDAARNRNFIWRPETRHRLDQLLPRWLTGGVFGTRYWIYPSLSQVPRVVWWMDRLIVEKFLPEYRDNRFFVRYAKVLGDHCFMHVLGAKWRVVKGTETRDEDRVFSDPSPHERTFIRKWQRRFGIDYGKFDYTLVDGDPVLFDVNATPGAAGVGGEFLQRRSAELLGGGIDMFFDKARHRMSDRPIEKA